MEMVYTMHVMSRMPRRGFSLIEVLVVAAILSILAGIGIVNVQQLMENNRRKATAAEARQLATAMSFANDDVGFFPKLNYLNENTYEVVPNTGDGMIDPALNGLVYPDVDYIGKIDSPQVHKSVTQRVALKWGGPYWAMAVTSTAGGRRASGFVMMQMPGRRNEERRWPSDPFGRPYVCYLLEHIDLNEYPNEAGSTLNGLRFLKDPMGTPNYIAAVVSYGKDHLPGLVRNDQIRKTQQALFTELFPEERYRLPTVQDFEMNTGKGALFFAGYSESKASNLPGYTGAPGMIGVTDGPILDNTSGRTLVSDDVVIEF